MTADDVQFYGFMALAAWLVWGMTADVRAARRRRRVSKWDALIDEALEYGYREQQSEVIPLGQTPIYTDLLADVEAARDMPRLDVVVEQWRAES